MRRHAAVMAVLSLLAVFSFAILEKVTADGRSNGALVNISGRQRMLSQRVVLLLDERLDGSVDHGRNERELMAAIALMADSHERMVHGDDRLGIPPLESAELRALFFGPEAHVDRDVRSFLERARAAASGPMSSAIHGDFVHSRFPQDLLKDLDRTATQFQKEGEKRVRLLEGLQLLSLLLTLGALLVSALAIFRPMTGRLREDLIRQQQDAQSIRKLSLAVEQSPAAIAITDTGGVVEYINPRFTRMTGFSGDELIGNNIRVTKSDEASLQACRKAWEGVLQGNEWRGIFHSTRRGGEFYWEENRISPIRDETGKISHVLVVKEDITQRKEGEEALRSAKEQADEANRAKSEFLSSMSHELRTPMNAILGFSQLLESDDEEPLTPAQRDSVQEIIKGGEYLLSLINEVLDLAKIESGKVSFSIERIAPREVVREVMILARNLAERAGLVINDKTVATPVPAVMADYTRFKQVLLNLLSNAIKYNRKGGSVVLDWRMEGAKVRLLVRDTGHGIPKERWGELFKPFSRLSAEGSHIEGTGIGLTIVKQLVERMGGQVGLDSEVGKGSTFWFDLPQAADGVHRQEEKEGGTAENPLRLLRQEPHVILYVEDNPANLRLMESLIARLANVRLISAHNAELGLELALSERPDVVVMDINLPGMDGYQALMRLKEMAATASTPVVALSANAMPSDVEKGLRAGFFRYLTKPIRIDEVLSTLNEALEERRRVADKVGRGG